MIIDRRTVTKLALGAAAAAALPATTRSQSPGPIRNVVLVHGHVPLATQLEHSAGPLPGSLDDPE